VGSLNDIGFLSFFRGECELESTKERDIDGVSKFDKDDVEPMFANR
jgi:hypothetical protein